MRRTIPILALLAACGPTVALTPDGTASPRTVAAAPDVGVHSITADDVRRRIFLIADDSMMGRGTPSPGLEMMANYAASEFRRLGLRPAGEDGGYIQRYPLEIRRFDPARSWVRANGTAAASWTLGPDVPLAAGQARGDVTAAELVAVLGDSVAGVTLPDGAVTGKVVLAVMGPWLDGMLGQVLAQRPAGILVVTTLPEATWNMMPGKSPSIRVKNPSEGGLQIPPVFAFQRPTIEAWLARAGLPAAALDARGPMRLHPLSGTTISFHVEETPQPGASAPNVIGVVEGSDPVLRNEYILYSAHMDHIGTPGMGQGCTAQGADSVCNGADDDGSGTVGVLELAEAWATRPVRPKRSMVFILVSGEERGLWGSAYWAAHPTLPLQNVVAGLNLDMVGRNAPDTVAVIGRDLSDLSPTLDRVVAAHPEHGLLATGDLWPEEGLWRRSDHFSYATKGIPILYFTAGHHPEYHAVGDAPALIDTDKIARIARLLYHLGESIANTPERPQWDPAGRARVVEGATP